MQIVRFIAINALSKILVMWITNSSTHWTWAGFWYNYLIHVIQPGPTSQTLLLIGGTLRWLSSRWYNPGNYWSGWVGVAYMSRNKHALLNTTNFVGQCLCLYVFWNHGSAGWFYTVQIYCINVQLCCHSVYDFKSSMCYIQAFLLPFHYMRFWRGRVVLLLTRMYARQY